MPYLLGAAALLDIAASANNSTKQWISTIAPAECRLSVVAMGMAELDITAQLSGTAKQSYLRSLRHVVTEIEIESKVPPYPIDGLTVRHWLTLEADDLLVNDAGTLVRLQSPTRMVIATGIQHNLTLVEPNEHYHVRLQELGILVKSI